MSEAATMTLTEFLLARIAEDEAAARAAGGEWWHAAQVPGPTMRPSASWEAGPSETIIDSPRSLITYAVARDEFADHIARHDPARVLAECEAKRRLVKWLSSELFRLSHEDMLMVLAAVYADHPDYREEWRALERTTRPASG